MSGLPELPSGQHYKTSICRCGKCGKQMPLAWVCQDGDESLPADRNDPSDRCRECFVAEGGLLPLIASGSVDTDADPGNDGNRPGS